MTIKSGLAVVVISFFLVACGEDDSGQDSGEDKDIESLRLFYNLLSYEKQCQHAYIQSFFGGGGGIGMRIPASRLNVDSRLRGYSDCSEIFLNDCKSYSDGHSCGLSSCGRGDSDGTREQIRNACESFTNACYECF